jgi:hypothetical protein
MFDVRRTLVSTRVGSRNYYSFTSKDRLCVLENVCYHFILWSRSSSDGLPQCYTTYWPPLWSSGQSSWLQNGDVLCFLWGTNWIYIWYVEESRPALWSSGQRSWLQNGDVLCFLWGTNWIYIWYVEESRPALWSSGQTSWLQNGDVLCFLWGTNWIYMCYVKESRPSLWSSGQSSWLQNGGALCFLWGTNWIYICYVEESRPLLWFSSQRSGFDSRRQQIFWVVLADLGLCRPSTAYTRRTDALGLLLCMSTKCLLSLSLFSFYLLTFSSPSGSKESVTGFSYYAAMIRHYA